MLEQLLHSPSGMMMEWSCVLQQSHWQFCSPWHNNLFGRFVESHIFSLNKKLIGLGIVLWSLSWHRLQIRDSSALFGLFSSIDNSWSISCLHVGSPLPFSTSILWYATYFLFTLLSLSHFSRLPSNNFHSTWFPLIVAQIAHWIDETFLKQLLKNFN